MENNLLKKGNVINAIKKRKFCHPRCAIFDLCPMMPLSMSRANKENKCLLNVGGSVLIRRFVNLMCKGEDGLLNEINSTLYSYAQDIEVAPPSVKERYAGMLLKLHDQLYCRKQGEFELKPSLTVVINEMGSDGMVREIKPIIPLVSTGHVSGRHGKLLAAVNDAEQDDPESLMGSEEVPKLFEKKKIKWKVVGEQNGIQEQDIAASDDESDGAQGEPEELEDTP